MTVVWSRLIRFVATDGRILHGEPILPSADFDLGTTTEDTRLQAKVIQGDDIYDISGVTKVTDEVVVVKKLLGPLTSSNVPVLRCIGLNYVSHSKLRWFSQFKRFTINVVTCNHSPRSRTQATAFPIHVL